MAKNITSGNAIGNSTGISSANAHLPLVLGLTLGLLPLVLLAVIAAVLFLWRRRSANIAQAEATKDAKSSGPEPGSPRYIASKARPPPPQHQAVYENVKISNSNWGQKGQQVSLHAAASSGANRLQTQNSEDLYMQCDQQDDAIYSNDPSLYFNYSSQTAATDDELYIVPDTCSQ